MLELLTMQTKLERLTPTKVKLTISSDDKELFSAKSDALKKLGSSVKVSGFRQGKAPDSMVEKNLDPNTLAQETLEIAVNLSYTKTLIKELLRPVNNPSIEVKAYVPYQKLDFVAEVDVVGDVKLPKYSGLSVARDPVKVSQKEIKEILDRLLGQLATRTETNKPAKNSDEVIIDFKGTDAKTNQAIPGAEGKDYPLILGSKTFIPGFEDNLLASKKEEIKDFIIAFPDDYGVESLQKKKVKFNVVIKQVNERILPPLDDASAKLIGQFNTVDELKADIKRELMTTKDKEALTNQQNYIVEQLVAKSEVDIPEALVKEEQARIDAEQRQNASYRGLTWSEYLSQQGLSDEEYLKNSNQQAEIRIKTGLVLGAIANQEKQFVTKQELDQKIAELQHQYATDKKMLEELNKPENQQDIQNRLLVEKTVNRLVELNAKP